MVPIFLVGNSQEVALGEQLTAALGKTKSVLHISPERVYAKRTYPYEFLLAEIQPAQHLRLPEGLLIYKSVEETYRFPKPDGLYALAPSVTGGFMPAPQVLRCGTGADDDLSLSSYSDGSASVSLLCALTRPDGDVIEPCEIPVRLSAQYDRFALLSAVAVLLLYGDADTEPLIRL